MPWSGAAEAVAEVAQVAPTAAARRRMVVRGDMAMAFLGGLGFCGLSPFRSPMCVGVLVLGARGLLLNGRI